MNVKSIALILTLFVSGSCHSSKEKKVEEAIDDLPEFSELYHIDLSNEYCQHQIDSAKKDVQNGKLVF